MRTRLIISAVLSLFVVAPISYMVTDNLPPYLYDLEHSYVVPQQTHAGHQIVVHWELVRINRVCPGLITHNIVDAATGVRTSYDPVPTMEAEQGEKAVERIFQLPRGIMAGNKFYYGDIAYMCNPLQRWRPLNVRTPTLPFEVLAGPFTHPPP